MSAILALESGGANFFVALRINNETRQLSAAAAPHSQHALPLVQQLLATAQMTISQCDAFAFGAGPGRFSGLRLACGIVQGFGFAVDRPGVAVDSLAALACANYGDCATTAVAALPAHRGHIYVANCRRRTRWISPRSRLVSVDDYRMATHHRRACGLGFGQYPQLLRGVRFCDVMAEPDAKAIALIAADMFVGGEFLAAAACQPAYVRRHVARTVAERSADKRSGITAC